MLKVEELTHNYLAAFCDFEKDLVLTNHFHSDWEADILIINPDGESHEIEIKMSRADFKNDFRKHYERAETGEKFLKHDKINGGDYPCNYFSFLVPMGLVAPEEVPDYSGMIEYDHNPDRWETRFHITRPPRQLHAQPFFGLVDQEAFLRQLARSLYFKKLEAKGRFQELVLPNHYTKR